MKKREFNLLLVDSKGRKAIGFLYNPLDMNIPILTFKSDDLSEIKGASCFIMEDWLLNQIYEQMSIGEAVKEIFITPIAKAYAQLFIR